MAHILSGCVLRDISFSSPGCPSRAGGSRKTTHALSVTIYRTQHLLRPPRRLSYTQAGRGTGDALAEASGGSSELNQSASCTGVMKVTSPAPSRHAIDVSQDGSLDGHGACLRRSFPTLNGPDHGSGRENGLLSRTLIGFLCGLRLGGRIWTRPPSRCGSPSSENVPSLDLMGGTKRFTNCPVCIMRDPGLSIHLSAWRGGWEMNETWT
jgi:hypothetical protein